MIIDQDNADVETTGNNQGSNNSPVQRPHDDWLAWLPWESQAGTNFGPHRGTRTRPHGLWTSSPAGRSRSSVRPSGSSTTPPTVGLSWNLSIGLKLP